MLNMKVSEVSNPFYCMAKDTRTQWAKKGGDTTNTTNTKRQRGSRMAAGVCKTSEIIQKKKCSISSPLGSHIYHTSNMTDRKGSHETRRDVDELSRTSLSEWAQRARKMRQGFYRPTMTSLSVIFFVILVIKCEHILS